MLTPHPAPRKNKPGISLVEDVYILGDVRVGELSVLHVLQRLGQAARDHLGVEAAYLSWQYLDLDVDMKENIGCEEKKEK